MDITVRFHEHGSAVAPKSTMEPRHAVANFFEDDKCAEAFAGLVW